MLPEELFITVLHLSFYGSIGCGVILICALINYTRTPRWISMILWGLVALRLVLPLSVSSTLSLLRLGNAADLPAQLEDALNSDDTYRGNYKTAIEGSREYELAVLAGSPVAANTEGGKMAYYYERANGSIAPAKTSYEMFLIIGSHVWLAGMAALWLWAICSYLRLKYRLRFSIRLCKGVYETDAVPSPCVTGILRPQIYLIPALTDQQKEHILLHEKMHIRHLDPVWKMVSFVVISIHWFNPFLWFMYKIFQGELEKACDERVLAHLGEDKKADYSESLLALSASKNWRQKWNFPTPVSFGENNIKGRIKRILAYQKPLAAVSVLTALLAAVGCVIFLTTPADSATDPSSTNPGTQTALNPPPDDTIPLSINTEPPLTDQPATQSTTAPTEITTTLNESIGPQNTEIYEELEYNGITYQAGDNGIFRKAENDSAAEQIYAGFAGTNLQMTVFEEKLFFKTDNTYTEGALDWADNTIRYIDLASLNTGELTMVRENALISSFGIYDGLIKIYYYFPDVVDTFMLYADKDTVFNHKSITQLSEAEQQQFGLGMTQSILQNTGTLVNLSNRVRGQNIAYLDMDADGDAEKITLSPSASPDVVQYYREDDPLAYYQLQIGSASLEGFGDNVANILWGISLDGQHILLVLYEDGPSADPFTHFYHYQENNITEIGGFACDIRLCEISSDGIITGFIRKEITQTDWITVRWQISQSGLLEEIPQDIYDFRNRNWVQLYEELPLHTAVRADDTYTIQPQNVRFLQTSADWNWVLLETEDGQQGWVHLDNFEVVELQKNVMDVFDGLYMAG